MEIQHVLLSILILITVLGIIAIDVQRNKRMQRYWQRHCMGRKWRRQFPQASKQEIRDFLNTFISSFGFGRKRRLKFQPSDKVMDVYRCLYPSYDIDQSELEEFAEELDGKYGFDLASVKNEEVTLGQLFEMVRRG